MVFTSDVGEIISGAVVNVIAREKILKTLPANFLTPLQDVTIEEGDTLTLKCQVAGEPRPEVKK